MRRYWWQGTLDSQSKEIDITENLYAHIFKVCRRKVGDHFELINEGYAYLVEVVEVNSKKAVVLINSKRQLPKLKEPHIHLKLSFSQPKVIDRVIEKSVELGVKSIQLISCENSFLKDQTKMLLKTKRALKIVNQAMQQSGRGEALELREPLTLDELLQIKLKSEDRAFILYEDTHYKSKPIEKHSESYPETIKNISILVGSEGGFSSSEVDTAANCGYEVLSLGSQILRVETACVASISILKSRLGLW